MISKPFFSILFRTAIVFLAQQPAGGHVGQNLPARENFFVFPRDRHRERNPQRIADSRRKKLLEGQPGFQNSLGRHARLGHAQMQRHVGPLRPQTGD